MKPFYSRLSNLSLVVVLCAVVAVILGLPPKWVGIVSFMVIDFAGIALAGRNSPRGKRAIAPSRSLIQVRWYQEFAC